MLRDALLEIGFEEIPAAYIQPAMAQAKTLCEKLLTENALNAQEIEIFATARRITLLIKGLAQKSAERTEEFMGPSIKAAIDANGGFTGAAKGFASKHGVKPEALLKVQTEKGEYLAVKKVIPGVKTQNLLSDIFATIISQLYFPKTMVWENSGFRFARPLRNIVAIFNDKTVKLQVADVKSSNTTFGLHTNNTKSIAIKSPEKYLSVLRNNCIIASTEERRTALVKAVSAAAKRLKCVDISDEELFDEINFLVEHPVAVAGNFDEKYLSIPKEVLINCMRKKQKFFALENEHGELTNNFIGIRNGISEYQDVVRDGYERVLKARLADAEFFFNKDTSTPLFNKVEKLNGVVFQKELGTVYQKMQRVIQIANFINEKCSLGVQPQAIERACLLAKADLVTDLVYEYPELQGTIGSIYANKDGEDKNVVTAIQEHYWPLSADGKLPNSSLSIIISIADKIDTLCGDFAAGLIPSGSADPYGLRRASVGVIRMLLGGIKLEISSLIDKAYSILPERLSNNTRSKEQMLEFFKQRFEALMQSSGYKFDEIKAVLAVSFNDFLNAKSRIDALSKARLDERFSLLTIPFKRASNIIIQAEKKSISIPSGVDETIFNCDEEKNLYSSIKQIELEVSSKVSQGDYLSALMLVANLKESVDEFFIKVMVMDNDEVIRSNRLALLKTLVGLISKIADISMLQG